MIKTDIIADSINPDEVRLTTFVITYPRFIHSEFMTHRAFSRNAASSRAIPIAKMMKAVVDEPASFEWWGQNEKGMQASGEVYPDIAKSAENVWLVARNDAVTHAGMLHGLGLHKQLVNRILEPWAHITVIATADNFGLANFFALRAHPAAQPEFQVLAYRMLNDYVHSKPLLVPFGDWHMPFADRAAAELPTEEILKVCTARCARVSLLNHDGALSLDDDLNLYDRLRSGRPPHASAFEHCAQAIGQRDIGEMLRRSPSNFHSSWLQYRKTIDGETTHEIDLIETLVNKPKWIIV